MIRRDIAGKPPRIGGPYIRIDAGEPFGELVLRMPLDSDARRIWSAYIDVALANAHAEQARAVANSAFRELSADAPEEDRHAAAQQVHEADAAWLDSRTALESISGYVVLRMWADPVWDLEARARYLAGEFAGEEDPAEAAGRVALEELHSEMEHGCVFATQVVTALREKLIPNPAAKEVKADADFSEAPTEQGSG